VDREFERRILAASRVQVRIGDSLMAPYSHPLWQIPHAPD
jgi:hypothetical protein